MTRRQHIENIIIGTLIAAFDEHWSDVRSCITPDMIEDEFNRDIFRRMKELHAQRQQVNLVTLSEGGTRTKEECSRLAQLADEYDFNFLKWRENNRRWMSGQPLCNPTFEQYVTRYITI